MAEPAHDLTPPPRAKVVFFPLGETWPTMEDARDAAEDFGDALVAAGFPQPVGPLDRLAVDGVGLYVGNKPIPLPVPAGAELQVYFWGDYYPPPAIRAEKRKARKKKGASSKS